MSAIAALYNVPGTPEELAIWTFAHAAHHRDIIRVIYETTGARLEEFPLDPVNPENPGPWLDQHQTMHAQMDAILGIEQFDLSEVKWSDLGERAAWIYLQAQEHYQAANILGIG